MLEKLRPQTGFFKLFPEGPRRLLLGNPVRKTQIQESHERQAVLYLKFYYRAAQVVETLHNHYLEHYQGIENVGENGAVFALGGALNLPPLLRRRYYDGAFSGIRLQHASGLLPHSGDSIAKVARYCGYRNRFGFSRAFHHAAGFSPLAYRKKYRN